MSRKYPCMNDKRSSFLEFFTITCIVELPLFLQLVSMSDAGEFGTIIGAEP